ncbi:MAG: hypothetical protein GY757_10475, partial [bacterium]|nr:hypothetical protein [bacterium]
PYVEASRGLREEVLLNIALMLKDAGEVETANRLFGRKCADFILKAYRRNDWFDHEALELLAGYSQAKVLTVIRKTRQRGERKWEDMDCWTCLYYAARAHEALHRPGKAGELYLMAAKHCHAKEKKQELIQKAGSL